MAGLNQSDTPIRASESWKHSHLLLTISSDRREILEGWKTSFRGVFCAHKYQKYLRSSRLRLETPRAAEEMDFILRHCSLMHFCYSTLFVCLVCVEFFYCLFNVFYRLPDHLRLLHCHQRHISHMHWGWEVGARATQRFQLHPLLYSVLYDV